MNRNYEDLQAQLFDFLADSPDGVTKHQIMDALSLPLDVMNETIRRLRHTMRADSINVICEPQGSREPWLYRLVGTHEDAVVWAANRVKDMETRLYTQESVSLSVVNATDGRTTEGKKARVIERTLRHMREILADIS